MAYCIPCFSREEGTNKFENMADVLEKHIDSIKEFGVKMRHNSSSTELTLEQSSELNFMLIKTIPWIGDFLAYQICIDIGY